MNCTEQTIEIIICILSFVLALISVLSVVVSLWHNSRQLKQNEKQLKEMQKEHELSTQPLLLFCNPSFFIERPRAFYSPPERAFSIQSRYSVYIDLKNVTDTSSIYVNVEARIKIKKDDKYYYKKSNTKQMDVVVRGNDEHVSFLFINDIDDLLFNSLRDISINSKPRLELIMYYTNPTRGVFKTRTEYVLSAPAEKEETLKKWHIILSSAETTFKEEIDIFKKTGVIDDKLFNTIKQKIDFETQEAEDVQIDCHEIPRQFDYYSVDKKQYEEVKKSFNYSILETIYPQWEEYQKESNSENLD